MSPVNEPITGGIMDNLGSLGNLGNTEFFSKIGDLFGETNPRLDKIKESVMTDLETLKKSKELESLAINMQKSVEKGLLKDLAELGVDEPKKAEILAIAREEWSKALKPTQMVEILKSPEKSALDTYITNLENLPVLAGMISTAVPQMKIVSWLEDKLNFLPDSVKKLFGGVSGMKDQIFLGLAGILPAALGGDKLKAYVESRQKAPEGAIAGGAPAATPSATAPAPAEKQEAVAELTEEETTVLQPLKDAGISMDPKWVKDDMAFLSQQGLDTNDKKIELTKNAVSVTGNTKKIYDAIKIRLGEEKAKAVGFRLVDVWKFEKDLTPENVTKITAAIPNIAADQRKMRDFLTAARDLKTKTDAIEDMTKFA